MLVYILESTDASRRTYVGATVNLARRLREHNGELVGGSKQTRGRQWRVACTITGTRTWCETLKLEFALRRVGRRRVRRWDLAGRKQALEILGGMERWSSTSPPACDVPLTIVWH